MVIKWLKKMSQYLLMVASFDCNYKNNLLNCLLLYNSFLVEPVIDPFKFPERIQKGMRARLVCTVIKGDPPFVFKWLKNNKTIESNLNNLAIRSEDFSSDLTFTKVSTLHNGNYTCVVSNSVSSTSHTAALFVDGMYLLLASSSKND